MEIEYDLSSIKIASEFILKNSTSNTFLFSGIIGAGKTTLIKQLCKDMGVMDNVNSPTYSIINEYLSNDKPIFHMDLFRVKKEEINSLGLFEYLTNENKVIIEWPEIIINQISKDYCHIKIEYNNDNMRTLKINNSI